MLWIVLNVRLYWKEDVLRINCIYINELNILLDGGIILMHLCVDFDLEIKFSKVSL